MAKAAQQPLFRAHVDIDGFVSYRPTYVYSREGSRSLPIGPFRRWLGVTKWEHEATNYQLAMMVGCCERTIRHYLTGPRKTVMCRTVERFGLAITEDPRVAEKLYPKQLLA